MLPGRRHGAQMVVACGSVRKMGKAWGEACGRESLGSTVESEGGEWEKKRGSGGVTPLRFVAYGGCDFILRRKDPINQSFP